MGKNDETTNSQRNINEKKIGKDIGYSPQGMFGTLNQEAIPEYKKRGTEIVIKGTNNCFIVLGKDREGYFGGEGMTPFSRTGAIDIVAGLASAEGIKLEDKKAYSPSFFKDGSRLYLSQKSDVDAYFGIVKGSCKMSSVRKSAAVLKADHTRIIANEHVKIVAGAARIKGPHKNSLGGKVELPGGIDLLAGNYDKEGALQPVVKGDNLEAFLKELISTISDINSRVLKNQLMITKACTYLISHVHTGPGTPSPSLIPLLTQEVIDSFSEITTCTSNSFNLEKINEIVYLNPVHDLYINSKLVHTT